MDGRILRYARQRGGLTQRQLAHAAHVSQPAISRIETGGVSPRLSTLLQLIEAAGFGLELVPRIGDGVDRTLIRSSLDRSPEERIRAGYRRGQEPGRIHRDRPCKPDLTSSQRVSSAYSDAAGSATS